MLRSLVGSEMCIRDSSYYHNQGVFEPGPGHIGVEIDALKETLDVAVGGVQGGEHVLHGLRAGHQLLLATLRLIGIDLVFPKMRQRGCVKTYPNMGCSTNQGPL